MFGDPSASDLQSGYSLVPKFIKEVPEDCILKCHLPLGIRKEAMEQHSKANSRWRPAACFNHSHWTEEFWNDQKVSHMQELACLKATSREPEELGLHYGDHWTLWMRAGRELAMVMEMPFLLHEKVEIV